MDKGGEWMSQLNELLERLATIQQTITITVPASYNYVGPTVVTSAFPYPTSDPSLAHAPFFYNQYNGAPKVEFEAVSGLQRVNNEIDMVLCFTTITAETNIANVYMGVSFWRDAVLSAFAGKIRLGGDLSYILDARITKIGKFEEVPTEGGSSWGALAFTIAVRELFPLTASL